MKKLEPGDRYSTEFSFSHADIELFAQMSDDTNNIRHDSAGAAKYAIGTVVIPGALCATKLAGIYGTQFPGRGAVYASEFVRWLYPMFVGVLYTVDVTVKRVDHKRHRARLDTAVRNKETNVIVAVSVAEIVHEELL